MTTKVKLSEAKENLHVSQWLMDRAGLHGSSLQKPVSEESGEDTLSEFQQGGEATSTHSLIQRELWRGFEELAAEFRSMWEEVTSMIMELRGDIKYLGH